MHYPNNIVGYNPQKIENPNAHEGITGNPVNQADLMEQVSFPSTEPQIQPQMGITPTDAESSPPRLVNPIEIEGLDLPPGSPLLPQVHPTPPHFSVPANPLLPEHYQEIISYENLQYLNGFLRTQIGKECLVTIVIGTSGTLATRAGYLIGVGINYILMQEPCSESIFVLDFYSIRLVQFVGKRCPVNLFI